MGPQKKKILVVDDEITLRKIMSIKLRACGYEVFTASNAREALASIDGNEPDCVLLDIIMPDIDGFEVLRRLRMKSNLPVVAFSARSENASKALDMGANVFVAKPFEMNFLVATIKSAIDSQAG